MDEERSLMLEAERYMIWSRSEKVRVCWEWCFLDYTVKGKMNNFPGLSVQSAHAKRLERQDYTP